MKCGSIVMKCGIRALLSLGLCAVLAMSCSNFAMNNDYSLSADTMDLGSDPYKWMIITRPQGISQLVNNVLMLVFILTMFTLIIPTLTASQHIHHPHGGLCTLTAGAL